MRRAPGSSSPGFSPAVVLVVLLAIVVVGGTAYGYQQWQDDIAAATATDTTNSGALSGGGGLPSAPSSDEASKDAKDGKGDDDKADPYEPPTFDVLEPTENRPQPVVLLVGDGYADGRGASSPGNSYASLISKELGWDVRLATAPGAGYLSGTSLLDLFTDSPDSIDPDLVLIQGGYGGDGSNDAAKASIQELDAAIAERYPDADVVAVSPFWPGTLNKQAETRERTVARAWREDPDVLVLRPQPDGWSTFDTVNGAPDDAGHELIATSMIKAFRDAGLAPPV
ncbi:SGNH/GDSL hydrolase family protein [Nocardioides sp.]|uniref:SGNH/GDSL hydrolase family protein n=1 Tax=Nocardioides sp. TaxID=35761 RepID=UPI0035164689